MVHALITAIIQIACGLLFGNWLIGALIACGFYVGRELAQAEYRWIERYGLGLRANMPWWGPLDSRVWNLKSLLDWVAPILVSIIVIVAMR